MHSRLLVNCVKRVTLKYRQSKRATRFMCNTITQQFAMHFFSKFSKYPLHSVHTAQTHTLIPKKTKNNNNNNPFHRTPYQFRAGHCAYIKRSKNAEIAPKQTLLGNGCIGPAAFRRTRSEIAHQPNTLIGQHFVIRINILGKRTVSPPARSRLQSLTSEARRILAHVYDAPSSTQRSRLPTFGKGPLGSHLEVAELFA